MNAANLIRAERPLANIRTCSRHIRVAGLETASID
jgi:hypothetical protein